MMSHIKYSDGINKKDAYIWPSYNDRKIVPINRIKNDYSQQIITNNKNRDEIIKNAEQFRENVYNNHGNFNGARANFPQKGLLFNALV